MVEFNNDWDELFKGRIQKGILSSSASVSYK